MSEQSTLLVIDKVVIDEKIEQLANFLNTLKMTNPGSREVEQVKGSISAFGTVLSHSRPLSEGWISVKAEAVSDEEIEKAGAEIQDPGKRHWFKNGCKWMRDKIFNQK